MHARMSQVELRTRNCKSSTNTFNGDIVERWLLKVVVGMSASNNFARDGQAINSDLPETWLKILEGEDFPALWGLYVNPPTGVVDIANRQFSVQSMSIPEEGVRAAHFVLAGVPMALVLGFPDNLKSWGYFRPSEFNFSSEVAIRKLRMRWQGDSSQVPITFHRVKTRK